MKKRIGILSLVSVLLVLLAVTVGLSASFMCFYQPKAPKCLK